MSDDSVQRLAQKYCAQENEIWEETGAENRKRFILEARTAIAELKEQEQSTRPMMARPPAASDPVAGGNYSGGRYD